MVRALLLIAVGAGGVLGAQAIMAEDPEPPPRRGPAGFEERPPQDPGDPPVVWVGGTLESITTDRVVVRAGGGPAVALNRLGGGATSFHRLRGEAWRRTDPARVSGASGQPVCVETLLDGRTLLALRVFLGASCRPL